jgi:hypothetical protein
VIGGTRTRDSLLSRLNVLNPDLGISAIHDAGFRSYGRLLPGFPSAALLAYIASAAPVAEAVVFEPDAIGMDRFPVESGALQRQVFAGTADLQLGWVHGRNARLAALEYHKCAQVVIAATDMVVFMGHVQDIGWPDGTYDISRVQAFLAPRGTVYEISPCSLHSTPLHARQADGFACAVMSPRGTSDPIDFVPGDGGVDPRSMSGEARLMHLRGTWLLAHPDSGTPPRAGAAGGSPHFGLLGRVIELRTP